MENIYSKEFYEEQQAGSLKSAKEVAPILLSLLKVKSIVDVGCGVGPWLKAFYDLGIKDILGIDGLWVNKNQLMIPKSLFLEKDLEKPLNLSKKYDLVISLEVAEHLPERYAKSFIEQLTKLGDFILFSAAIPSQGGTCHLNEQWQIYWAKLFEQRDFLPVDYVRGKIWDNNNVDYHYRQNIILYVKKEKLKNNKKLYFEYKKTKDFPLSIVHPKYYYIPATRYNKFRNFFPEFILKIVRMFFGRDKDDK
jgi:SAM-dependent methyltransferase